MNLFEVLKAGWSSLDEKGKLRVINEISPSEIVRDIVMSFDHVASTRAPEDLDNEEETFDEDEDDSDIIEAEIIDIKGGFGA